MEKGDFRRERLAELGLDRLQRPPERAWRARVRRMRDHWHRFAAGGWEHSFLVLACAVAVLVAVVGAVAMAARGGGSNGGDGASVHTQPTAVQTTGSVATPTAITIGVPDIPTALPTETPPPEPTEDQRDRTDCDEIRGTPYRSQRERDWFAKNCGVSVSGPPSQPPASTVNTPVPPPTSPPSKGLTAGAAISLGVSWMTTSAPKAYTVDSATCSAVHIGDHWIVSCTARLAGCQTSTCDRQLEVCVFADRRVVAGASC